MEKKNEICEYMGEVISFLRKQNEMTQKELAEKLGVKNTAVSAWERGTNPVDVITLYSLCVIFGVYPQVFFDFQDTDYEGKSKHLRDVVNQVRSVRKSQENFLMKFMGMLSECEYNDYQQELILAYARMVYDMRAKGRYFTEEEIEEIKEYEREQGFNEGYDAGADEKEAEFKRWADLDYESD